MRQEALPGLSSPYFCSMFAQYFDIYGIVSIDDDRCLRQLGMKDMIDKTSSLVLGWFVRWRVF